MKKTTQILFFPACLRKTAMHVIGQFTSYTLMTISNLILASFFF